MTTTVIPDGHYDNGTNLNKGARKSPSDPILEDTIQTLTTDANESAAKGTLAEGAAALALLTQGGQPADTNTIDVGADTYQFLTTPLGATSDIEVEISAVNAEGSLDNLLAAAIASQTESLLWDKESATVLRLRSADAPNGSVAAADPDIGIDASGCTNWAADYGDVNMNTLAGKASAQQQMCATKVTITTAIIAASPLRIPLTFTPTSIQVTAYSSDVPVTFTADTFAISGTELEVGLGTDLANGDVVHIVAYS